MRVLAVIQIIPPIGIVLSSSVLGSDKSDLPHGSRTFREYVTSVGLASTRC